ncbi:uncharacterized protein LOC116164370 [Photinus pyralis]|uniref:uncharacterized protein LOC116164370 n=2 Tax=Photinus pyralis TaxID=7054 RepID=UPI00126734DA|nr:uncharacterized protein LOC116164370 [Photinus pyralis]
MNFQMLGCSIPNSIIPCMWSEECWTPVKTSTISATDMGSPRNVNEPSPVENILQEWNLAELIPVFNENFVDYDVFSKLSEDHIKELVPKIGPRIRFLAKYKHWFDNKSQPILIDEDTPWTLHDTSHTQVPVIESPTTSEPSSIADCQTIAGNWSDAIVGLNDVEIVNTPTYQYKVTCAKNTGLEDLLNSSTKGRLILYSYNKNGKLTSDDRNKLVEFIIESELENDLNRSISCVRFEELAHAIVGIFTKECKEVYFMKTTHFKNGKTTQSGRGKLFFKYYNFRKQLKSAGLIKTNNATILQSSDEEGTENDEEKLNQLEWLKQYKEPFHKVQDYWGNTFKARQALLKEKNIYEYCNTFPILRSSCGYILLNNDFNLLYPKVDDLFYVNFAKFSEKILLYTEGQKDKILRRKLKEIEDCNTEGNLTCYYFLCVTLYHYCCRW